MAFDLAEIKKTVSNISRWAGKGDWADHLAELMDEHAGESFESYGIDYVTLRAEDRVVGQMLFNAVMDDLCSHLVMTEDEDDDGDNLVEDYLKHGYREKPQGIEYLKALQETHCTLLEVLGVEPGKWVEARDLIGGGPTVRVAEKLGSSGLERGDFIATKLLDLDGARHFSGSMLPLNRGQADAVLDFHRTSMRELEEQFNKMEGLSAEDAKFSREIVETTIKMALAPFTTSVWLSGMLNQLYGPPPEQAREEILLPNATSNDFHEMADADYLAMLDEPSEVLGGRTPRQMSQSKKRKHQEDAMLFIMSIEMAENFDREASGKPPYDATWLWKELGLKNPRKS